MQFPEPVQLPESVFRARRERFRQVVRSVLVGVGIRLGIIALELSGVFLFGSSALLMDALASLADVVFSVSLLLCVKLAGRPPDEDHPFGHGRYEPLIGLQLGLLLSLLGGGMIVQQSFQLASIPKGAEIHPWMWLFPLVACLALELCYQIVMRAAKKYHSTALGADAIHYRIDGLTSMFATLSLALAAIFPQWSLVIDHLGAITIACLMIMLGLYAARSNIHQLMDKLPDDHFFGLVREAAKKTEGVFDTEKIRIQLYGPDAHVDIDIEVDPHLTVELAHTISQKVRAEIQKAWPAVRDVTVHIEPFYPNDH